MPAHITFLDWARTQKERRITLPDLARALSGAYRKFRRRYPEWAASLFDEHFLTTRVLPLALQKWPLDAAEVAGLWAGQFSWANERLGQELIAELMPAAACFVLWLKGGLQAR